MTENSKRKRFNPLRSFACALGGLVHLLATQPNTWIYAAVCGLVIVAAAVLHLAAGQWCWLIVAMAMVWATEALNTALEQLADVLHPEQHPLIGKAKDLAATAVLVAVIAAAFIGLIVFLPALRELGLGPT